MKSGNTDDSTLWLALGFVLGFASIGLLGLAPFILGVTDFFESHDTTIGSLFALLAAAFAFYAVLVQIRNSNAMLCSRIVGSF